MNQCKLETRPAPSYNTTLSSVERFPNNYDLCPLCGEIKAKVSAMCRACRFPPRASIPQPSDPTIRHLPLTQGYYVVVSAEGYERASTRKWHVHIIRCKDGSVRNVYAISNIVIDGRRTTIKLHRFLMGITDPLIQIDHEDGEGLTCVPSNMRTATKRQNNYNSRKRYNSTAPFKGMTLNAREQKYRVQIWTPSGRKCLGRFPLDAAEEAARCYDYWAVKLQGAFACTNVKLGLLPPLSDDEAAAQACKWENEYKLNRNNSSGYMGVASIKSGLRWKASARLDGRQRHLGLYDTAKEAARVRDAAIVLSDVHTVRTWLNFPDEPPTPEEVANVKKYLERKRGSHRKV
jgi:hypothetical protein